MTLTSTAGPPAALVRHGGIPHPASRSWRTLARHYLEMVVAMTVGMLVLGAGRAALGLTVSFSAHPGASYLLMATDMALGMAAWMLVRGHGPRSTAQMCAAMYVPVALLPLVWASAMAPMTFMVLAHVAMALAMLGVLLAQHRSGRHGSRSQS